MAPIPTETPTQNSPRDPPTSNAGWSKEALFGLLGILFVLLVPCLCLVLKHFCVKRGDARRPQKCADVQVAVDNTPSTRWLPLRRGKGLRMDRRGRSVIVIL
ncbi:hypothetical protein K505DRAFT_328580 [Melanomma pulvis-pyrius CBS 109.77]|uniref:Uncharacterized protein n=1 Tax=Melanomma pulvis-pyrius CBS 109.77 TaxID=1314802 RepID=A0A6A6WXG9_9PLEO|nr:hypothetical protein K505DRAFT_328580 [Melanomma pulvis-pyrius CBS 109.77]